MAEAWRSTKFLASSMAKLRVGASPFAWTHSASGKPAEKSHLGLTFAGAPSTAQLHILWELILIDVVSKLGGNEPVHICERTADSMFQSRVSFQLPLNKGSTVPEDFVVVGMKCSTSVEARTEASAAALQELQHGRLSICIIDVSRMRCRELERECHQILASASVLYDQVNSLLLAWEGDMDKAEHCYSPRRLTAGKARCNRAASACVTVSPAVANHLFDIICSSYERVKGFAADSEEIKTYIDKTQDRVKYFFREPSFNQEIELCMKMVLQLMIGSLGWAWPTFKVIRSGRNLYCCETFIVPNQVHIGTACNPMVIIGPEASSEEQAIESSCKAAILALEREKSICLVDINYNHRSHGELYVVEAKEAVRFASFIGSKILDQWQAMVHDIHSCQKHCEQLVMEHPEEEKGSCMYKMKCTSAEAVACLHVTCLADLNAAKHGSKNVGI